MSKRASVFFLSFIFFKICFSQEAQTWSGLGGETSLKLVFDAIVEPALSDQHALLTPVTLSPLASAQACSMLKLYFASSPEVYDEL